MTADRWSDVLALLAGVVGLVVVFRSWPRPPRRTQVARLRHPSAPPPVAVSLDTSADPAHWRVSTSSRALPTTVDIVTWRPVDSAEEWRSEPIIEPVVLAPGDTAILTLDIEDPTAAHLVVVAWTVKHPDGDVQGSRTMTIEAKAPAVPAPAAPQRGAGWAPMAMSALVAGLLVVLALVAGWRVLDASGTGAADTSDSATTPTTVTPQSTSAVTDTSPPPSDAATATTPATLAGTTTSTSPGTSPGTTTGTTVAGTTLPTAASSTTVVAGTTPSTESPSDPSRRSIDARGRVEDCRFGADCLIASFSAIGFPTEGEYVCEFGDGTRFTFRYAGGGALDACATAGAAASITIEIDGVRSATISRQTLAEG